MSEVVAQVTQDEPLSDDVINTLKEIIQQNAVTNYKIDQSPGSSKGDNFLGVITKVVVKGQNASGEEKILNFIVKCGPRIRSIRQHTPMVKIYQREIYVYEKVLKEFTKFQKDKKISNPFNSFAKYYTSLINESNEAVIMENMKELGYELHDKRTPFNYDRAVLAAREYGKLHAVSFALRNQNPDLFYELTKDLKDFLYAEAYIKGSMKEFIDRNFELALKSLDPTKDSVAYKKFQKFSKDVVAKLPELVSSEAAGKYAVIGHGDCWKNNMLFKYEDSQKPESPTSICFLDWQICRLGSPILDLSYLIFGSTTKDLRDAHYKTFIDQYYESLTTNLKALGSDPEILFPISALKEQLDKFSLFGLYIAVSALIVTVCDGKDMPDIHNTKENDIQGFVPNEEALQVYRTRIRDVILDFVRNNYLE